MIVTDNAKPTQITLKSKSIVLCIFRRATSNDALNSSAGWASPLLAAAVQVPVAGVIASFYGHLSPPNTIQ